MDYTKAKLTLEDLNKFVKSLKYERPRERAIEIPAGYLLAMPDEEFIAMFKGKTKYHVICSAESTKKIEERKKQLL